jgi:hypothetical protein
LRREYWKTIGEVKLSDLVFIDETGVNLAMTRRYARATKGKRAYGKCPNNRGKNVTLIGALARSGFFAPFTFEGWTNQEAFLTYVKEVLVPELWPGACVVMDNLPAHKVINVCWSKIKEYLRSQESRNNEDLNQAISKAIDLVTDEDIIGWFTHCCYYEPSN